MNKSDQILSSSVFKLTIEQLNTAVFITDTSGEIIYVNPYFEEKTGYTRSEAVGKNPSLISSGEHSSEFYNELWETILNGKTWKGEIVNRKKNGDTYCSEVTISPIMDLKGDISHFVAIEYDISAQKEALYTSIRRENLLNDIQFLSDTGGWHFDVGSGEMYWTDELYKIHGLKKDQGDDLITTSLSCYHPDDRIKITKAFRRLLAEGEAYDHTMRITDFKGNQKWIRTTTRAVKGDNGKVQRAYGSVMDVTRDVTAKESLYSSYKERGVLLSEIHHRVKNNLAMISGLLQLQVMGMSDIQKKDVLNKSIHRINAISLIHEQLYRSENFSEISLAHSIRMQAKEMYRIFDIPTRIEFDFDLENVVVSINQAQPVGLLIHEMLSNSFKYAFEGRRTGMIKIHLHSRDNEIYLYVSDDGVGVDTKVITEGSSLGSLLIQNLIIQLDAESSVRNINGLCYQLKFKKEVSNKTDRNSDQVAIHTDREHQQQQLEQQQQTG